jgi:transcriptional regulator
VYLPAAFRVDDRATLLAHAAGHPFATVVTAGPGGPAVSHLPLLVDAERGVLQGHLARESEQLAHLEAGAVALAVFHGPHGYVSPSVYADPESVPTWNYVVVHARGRARVVDEAALRAILAATVARFDATGWRLSTREETLRPLVAAIAGFEIAIERLEGKWKLSQNRSPEDRASVAAWLARGDASSRELAEVMLARAR